MPREEEISKNADTTVFISIYLKWRNCLQPTAQEIANVCQNGCLLDLRIPDYFKLFHEE